MQPASVALEFLTWFAWWVVYMVLQRKLCRRHPGLRTVCRMIFLWTVVVALAPGVWALLSHSVHGPRLVALFNHAFGAGVFAQTSLRSLLLVRWLALPGPQSAAAAAGAPSPLVAEHCVVASLVALSQLLRRSGGSTVSPVKTSTP
jgi:hypothetical protein